MPSAHLPPAPVADLLSDTLTKPTPGMRAAMAEAVVGDDVFGEDPTVRELEEQVSGLLGHEAGLFTPTGSLANQLALRLHVAPGEEMLADELAHVVRAELGAAAAFSGITSRTWPSDRGRLDPAAPLRLLATGVGPYQVCTSLVVVENTHNFGGGTIQPLAAIRAVRAATQPVGVRMHLDGARLWNAHVATGIPLDDYGREFDSVSVCLSKGLGAPVGSVLVGSSEFVAQARIWRKRYGAGMRQVGILAAAGRYAVEHHLARLADDHERTARVAVACANAAPASVDPAGVETNILMLDVAACGWSPGEFVAAAGARGVRVYAAGPRSVRAVWHLDVDDAATDHAGRVLATLLAGGGRESAG
ncbi:MAG: low specificity L-threonine aldolase [Actinomycetales bacterium]|nr:low specificity L-threonine aldolase [Actinomycetales bacterium]